MSEESQNPYRKQWEGFRDKFDELLPSVDIMKQKDFAWIENYVQDTLRNAFKTTPSTNKSKAGTYKSEVFETHNFLITRIQLPKDVKIDDLSLKVCTDSLKIMTYGSEQPVHTRDFPLPVVSKTAAASYKNGVLQVRVRKSTKKKPFIDVPIRFL